MRVALRPRAYIRVAGRDAGELLQRLLSNDVEALGVGAACDALLLTAKGRVIAPLRVWRRGSDDFLLLTEPELGDTVRSTLERLRLRADALIAAEEHTSTIVLDEIVDGGIPTTDYGGAGSELLDADLAPTMTPDELERLRIDAVTPAWGKEIDGSILPAEAGLDQTHVSWTKGCYPGQEPVARLHYRGHPNRTLRRLELDASPGEELVYDGKVVGRVTSGAGGVVLAYVRREVPEGADLEQKKEPSR